MQQDRTETETPTLEGFQQQLGYHFSDPERLHLALTHRSCLQDGGSPSVLESPGREGSDHSVARHATSSPASDPPHDTVTGCPRTGHNERLEFLGDAVLALVISDLLFQHYPEQPEGVLSHWRSTLVNTKTLGRIGRAYHLGHFLKMGRGEVLSGGQSKTSLLGNAMEALLGAIYLDGGYAAVYAVIQGIFTPYLHAFRPGQWEKDYKSMLQQYAQSECGVSPSYELLDEKGPDHAKAFEVCANVFMGGQTRSFPAAWDISKKEAEQKAARLALEELGVLEKSLSAEEVDAESSQ